MSPAHSLLDPPKWTKNYFCQVFFEPLAYALMDLKHFGPWGPICQSPGYPQYQHQRLVVWQNGEKRIWCIWRIPYLIFLLPNFEDFEILKKNLKYVNTSNTLNTGHFKIFEAKNLKYVNTPNTLNTRHFKIWMKKVKYVNTPNTLNTGHFKISEEKKSNTEYVKYVKYVFSPVCHTTSLWCHKSLRTLCDGPETMTEWKSESVTDLGRCKRLLRV